MGRRDGSAMRWCRGDGSVTLAYVAKERRLHGKRRGRKLRGERRDRRKHNFHNFQIVEEKKDFGGKGKIVVISSKLRVSTP